MGLPMYLPKDASRSRIREAHKARENRLEIVRALSTGQVTRRELFKWGLFTSSGLLAWKNGLNVYAPSAYGQVPTGTPRSPLFGARKFTQPFHRLNCRCRCRSHAAPAAMPCFPPVRVNPTPSGSPTTTISMTGKRQSRASPPAPTRSAIPSPSAGPMEGRPPGEVFAHQRWDEFFPKVGYVLSLGEMRRGLSASIPTLPYQEPNSVWTYGTGKNARGRHAAAADQGPLRRADPHPDL